MTCELCADTLYLTSNNTCVKCTPPCATCGATHLTCKTCIDGYFPTAGTVNGTVTCTACTAPCVACSDEKTCTTCNTGYKIDNKTNTCVKGDASASTPKAVMMFSCMVFLCTMFLMM
uniref:Uncharacterized protein n=1 Tax=Lygus hesperus TaxID=30085 RepID=A0A0A9W582_LYGHE